MNNNGSNYDDDILVVIGKAIPELQDKTDNYADEWKTLNVISGAFTDIGNLIKSFDNMRSGINQYIKTGQEISSQADVLAPSAPAIDVDGTNSQTNAKVNAHSIYLREGAGTKNAAKAVLTGGTELEILGPEENGWVKVKTADGKEGYVASKYVEKTSAPSSKIISNTKVSSNCKSINLRSGAGTSNNVKAILSGGAKLQVIGPEENGWVKVRIADGKEGYVASKYLDSSNNSSASSSSASTPSSSTFNIVTPSNYQKYDKPSSASVSTNGSNLNFRTGPGTENAKISGIPNNTQIKVLGESGEWSRIKYGDQEGWVKSSYLKKG